MVKKYFYTTLLLVVVSALYTRGQNHRLTAGFGYSLHGYHAMNMNKFVNSFNTYYQVGMKKPFDNYQDYQFQGVQFNIGYRYLQFNKTSFSYYMGYSFSHSEQGNSVKIHNNTGYDLETAFSCHDFSLEAGVQIKSRFYMHGLVGLGIRDIQAKMWKVYQDGSRSMGYEYDINGWYQTNSFSWQFGGTLGFRIWHFMIPIKVWYEVPFTADNMLSLTDFDVNRYRNSELPNDYNQWLNSNVVKDENNRIPENDFMGLRIQAGIEFMIPFKKGTRL